MNLVVISPERDDPREHAVLDEMFGAGLERYHVRKPTASALEVENWIERVPGPWRSRLVLHQHHELVAKYGLGGCHWRDAEVGPASAGPGIEVRRERAEARPTITSRSCHDLATLRASLGCFDAVFFSPVFHSISKPGYGPNSIRGDERERVEGRPLVHARGHEAVSEFLRNRTAQERRTTIFALSGITAETAPRALELGFDGVAALGAIWQALDPVASFRELQRVMDRTIQTVGRELARDELASNPNQPHIQSVGRGLHSAPIAGSAGNGVPALPDGSRHSDSPSYTLAVGTSAATS